MDNIKITDLADGGCIVEMDGEVTYHTKEEIDEMERDYKDAIRRSLARSEYLSQRRDLSKICAIKGVRNK